MKNSYDYIEVILAIDPFSEQSAEIVEAALSDLPYESFMYGEDADGRGVLKAYIPKSDYDARSLRLALSGLDFSVSFTADIVPPKNWNAEWEGSVPPLRVGRDVLVKTVHPDGGGSVDNEDARYRILINPQMAFGTGWHDTTRMMIEAMLEHEHEIREGVVMDMGCGTGILAILAARMGARHSFGVDVDAVAAQSGVDNARLNNVDVKIMCGDASLLQRESYDVLLANIHRNVIIADMETYAGSLKRPGKRYSTGVSEGGILLCSGFYESDCPDIIHAAENHGLKLSGRRTSAGWACLSFSF